MEERALYFLGPGQVQVREAAAAVPAPGQVRVRTLLSAISAGTELLLYRGQAPAGLPADETIPALAGVLQFPLKYGYSTVGRVEEVGENVAAHWLGRRVFAFNPHESCFLSEPEQLIPLPETLSSEDAVFLPNMETAVSLVMDGHPVIGERVVVFGLGVVGLLVTALLARFPLALLAAVDPCDARRAWAQALGAHQCFHPDEAARLKDVLFDAVEKGGADLCLELSGNPAALDSAIAAAGYGGRIVVGSWYGTRKASLDLGGRFHRARIRIMSSQVSTLDPAWRGRWNRQRRREVVLRMLETVRPARLITHRFSLEEAPLAFDLLDREPGNTLQVIFVF